MSRVRPPRSSVQTHVARVAIGMSALLVAGQVATTSAASADPAPAAAPATFVDLGTAATYSILGGTGVANTGAGTVLSGDLGLSPSGVISGFKPSGLGTVNGTIHDKDAAAETAQEDRAAAYADAAAQTPATPFAGDQGGVTFHPGVYNTAAAFTNTGTITLDADGDSSAVFVFQVGAALSSAASTKVVLTDGALANNVFWQASGAISLGAGAKFVGTLLGAGAISLGEGASIKGRALTPLTVAATNSPFTEPVDDLTAPVVTVDGGPAHFTNDTTPPISGTTDESVGKLVTITVGGQTLKTTVRAGGGWSVSAGALSSGPHELVASITDGSQNTGRATQVLTVDETAPLVSITGGARAATKDSTPVISGTTDVTPGKEVTVQVGEQTRTATVAGGGTWSVPMATLSEAPHLVVASVEDAARNIGTANQVLSVDMTLPVVTINGGAADATDDTSPWIYGTTAEQAGTTVHVTVGGQVLTATAMSGGTWGVSATTLPAGAHVVVASITDAAHNTGTETQNLTVAGDIEPTPTYKPDTAIRPLGGRFVGVKVYEAAKQRLTKELKGAVRSATFEVRVTNRGNSTDRLKVLSTPRSPAFVVTYLAGTKNVTAAVTAGTYLTSRLSPGASAQLTMKVTRTKATDAGDRRRFAVRASSGHAATVGDTVLAVVVRA